MEMVKHFVLWKLVDWVVCVPRAQKQYMLAIERSYYVLKCEGRSLWRNHAVLSFDM